MRENLLRILIADDNEAVRNSVSAILQPRGDIEVCGEACNGKEAIAKARLLKPDLIILDLSLPDLSGWDVAKTVRESLPAVPILLLTAHGGSPMIEEIRRRGLQGYVSKSEADTTLLAAIDAILHLKQGFFPTN